MKVAELMCRDVQMATPDDTVVNAAKMMSERHLGYLPIREGDRLVGSLTDRDIVVRCVTQGAIDQAKIRDAMTQEVKYCFEDDEIENVAQNMADIQVRRLPVLNREKRLVGVVSLADIALQHAPQPLDTAMSGIAKPGGQHTT